MQVVPRRVRLRSLHEVNVERQRDEEMYHTVTGILEAWASACVGVNKSPNERAYIYV
jgi:hypothetical protein